MSPPEPPATGGPSRRSITARIGCGGRCDGRTDLRRHPPCAPRRPEPRFLSLAL